VRAVCGCSFPVFPWRAPCGACVPTASHLDESCVLAQLQVAHALLHLEGERLHHRVRALHLERGWSRLDSTLACASACFAC
jgi:hypothetical protein